MRDVGGLDRRIRFRIGLRSDVYFLVRTSDESTDKIERNVIWLRWTNDEILRLAAKRIETFFGQTPSNEDLYALSQSQISKTVLSKVIDPVFQGLGHWSDRPIHSVLLSLTRARPRDLVKLLQGAAKTAHGRGHTTISSEDLENSFQSYSQDRLQDIINEFRSELPDIEKLLLHMRPTKKQRRTAESYQFATDQLSLKLQEILTHVNLRFTNGRYVTPRSLIQFLYKIDFITARRTGPTGIDRKYFDESRFLANEIVEFGYDWEIHPAYRWALQPQDIQDVIDSLRDWSSFVPFPPKWSTLRVIGNSTLVRATVVMPFIGYLILFNSHIVEALRPAVEIFPDCANGGCAQSFIWSRLFYLYFGLIFLGVGSFVYQLRCDPNIKRFDTSETFTASVSAVVTESDLFTYQEMIERVGGPAHATRDFLAGELANLDQAPRLKLSILNKFYRAVDGGRYFSRLFVALCYFIGFALVLFPSSQTSIHILVILLKFLRDAWPRAQFATA
jgi:hypothetical protein